MYAEEFSGERIRDVKELEAKYGVKDVKMLKASGTVLTLVILGFFLNPIIHIPVSWVALVGAVVMLLVTDRHELEEPLEKVEWTTLIFFAGLFVLIHSLQHLGVISWIGPSRICDITLTRNTDLCCTCNRVVGQRNVSIH